jgi:integrase
MQTSLHMMRVQAALDQSLENHPELALFFDANKSERFFIKNLERVQEFQPFGYRSVAGSTRQCDGATWHSSYTARDRDRLRQQQLEKLGWRFHRIWSTDWFLRKEDEIRRALKGFEDGIVHADKLDRGAVPNNHGNGNHREHADTSTATPRSGSRPYIPTRPSITQYTTPVAATGIRASEMLGLCWSDILWERSEIKIKQTFVHGKIQQGAKTKLSKSSIAMHPVLAQLLKDWRAETPYAADDDYVFASSKLGGRKPRLGSMVVEDYLQPAATRAGVLEVKGGKRYIDGEFVKRFGFHTFRHSLTSWLMANGKNPQIVRSMLRWTNLNMLAHYAHGFKSDKLEAQGAVLNKLVRSGVKSGVGKD